MDVQVVGNWMEDKQVEDNLQQDSLEPEEVDNHRAVHMPVEVGIQRKEEKADQCATSAEQEALPSLVVAQICHLVYPFRSYVASVNVQVSIV